MDDTSKWIMQLRALGYDQVAIAKELDLTQSAVSQRLNTIKQQAEEYTDKSVAFWNLILGPSIIELFSQFKDIVQSKDVAEINSPANLKEYLKKRLTKTQLKNLSPHISNLFNALEADLLAISAPAMLNVFKLGNKYQKITYNMNSKRKIKSVRNAKGAIMYITVDQEFCLDDIIKFIEQLNVSNIVWGVKVSGKRTNFAEVFVVR